MPRVLVVEDEPAVRMVIRFWITRIMQWEVVEVANGQVARDLFLADEQVEVVICDFNMPRMNGLEFYQAVASELARRQTIFMWHCAPKTEDEVRRVRAIGRRLFLKPGDMPEIEAYIRQEVETRAVVLGLAGLYSAVRAAAESG